MAWVSHIIKSPLTTYIPSDNFLHIYRKSPLAKSSNINRPYLPFSPYHHIWSIYHLYHLPIISLFNPPFFPLWNPYETLMKPLPIGSMYGIYANIWGILMVKYGKCYHIYSIHGSYGFGDDICHPSMEVELGLGFLIGSIEHWVYRIMPWFYGLCVRWEAANRGLTTKWDDAPSTLL
jgi:hypothetical protein